MRLEKLHVICTRGGCRVLRGLWGKIMGMGSPPKKIVLEPNFDYLENSSRLILKKKNSLNIKGLYFLFVKYIQRKIFSPICKFFVRDRSCNRIFIFRVVGGLIKPTNPLNSDRFNEIQVVKTTSGFR